MDLHKIYKYLSKNSSSKEVFNSIYRLNSWNSNESVSGTGSTLEQTKNLRISLDHLIAEFRIETILDIPCGDFNWMQHVTMNGMNYVGADIVKPLIKQNKLRYGETESRKFRVLDIIHDRLPKSDLVFVRDCFVHLSFQEIGTALHNIRQSGSTYLLTTTFPEHPVNEDSSNGGWRTLNLQKPPFSLPEPILLINEHCTEENGIYGDKSMALYELAQLPNSIRFIK